MALERWRCLLPAIWLGALLCLAAIATPAPFAVLDRAEAGQVVAPMLLREAWLSLIFALLLLFAERRRTRDLAGAGSGSVLSTDLMLLLGTLFCTVFGYFGLQPLMPAAKAGHAALSFGQLHALSAAAYAVKLLLVAALAWRAVGAPISRPPSS